MTLRVCRPPANPVRRPCSHRRHARVCDFSVCTGRYEPLHKPSCLMPLGKKHSLESLLPKKSSKAFISISGGMLLATFVEAPGSQREGAGAGQRPKNMNLQNCVFSLQSRNCCSSRRGHRRLGWQRAPRTLAVGGNEVRDLT